MSTTEKSASAQHLQQQQQQEQQRAEMPTPEPWQHVTSPEPAHSYPTGSGAPFETQQAKAQQAQVQPDSNPMPTTYATPLSGLGSMPAVIDCPFCHQRTKTRIEEHSSSMTIITGIGLGCLCICLACLPCMLGWFQDTEHYCMNCNQRVAFVADGRPAQVIAPSNPPQGYHMGNIPQYGQSQQQPQPQQQQQHPSQQQGHGNPPPQYQQ